MSLVKEFNIKTKKDETVNSVDTIELIENLGVEGDIHAKGGNRQVIILDEKTKLEIDSQKSEGLCLKRFYGNIFIEGFDNYNIKKNSIVEIGNTKIKISQIGKRCFPECNIVKKGKCCVLSKRSYFGIILKGGQIKVGDKVKITNS